MAGSIAPCLDIQLVDAIAAGSTKVYGPIANALTVSGCYSVNTANAKTKVEVGTWNGSAFSATATIASGIDGAAGAITTTTAWLPLVTSALAAGSYIRVSAVDQASASVTLQCRATNAGVVATVA